MAAISHSEDMHTGFKLISMGYKVHTLRELAMDIQTVHRTRETLRRWREILCYVSSATGFHRPCARSDYCIIRDLGMTAEMPTILVSE